MKSDEVKAYIYIAAGVAVAFVAYRTVTAAGRAAGALGSAAASAASAVDSGIATGVGGIGSVLGLPTPSETIDDPAAVRYILDTEGWFEASKRGTASAFFTALGMPSGAGGSKVSVDVARRVSQAPANIQLDIPSDSALGGPSFNSIKNQGWSYF